jgi:L-ascorbate metabolism protein UlaG (beta-lactamase superfamily)
MKITWLGHSCYLLENKEGKRLVIDPFNPSIGYTSPAVKADLVTVSHDHHDHNAVDQLLNNPEVIKSIKQKELSGFKISGISSYHDDDKGSKRGENRIFIYEVDDLRLVHLGDLGHMLNDEDIKALGRVDILFTPVGSVYTINGEQANELVNKIKPILTIPMHYKTKDLKIDLRPIDDFLDLRDEYQQQISNFLEITRESITDYSPVVVLQPPK